jgi:signal transduction histidine kinase
MAERAEILGGRFAIDSVPGQGTEVRLEIPAPQGERQKVRWPHDV